MSKLIFKNKKILFWYIFERKNFKKQLLPHFQIPYKSKKIVKKTPLENNLVVLTKTNLKLLFSLHEIRNDRELAYHSFKYHINKFKSNKKSNKLNKFFDKNEYKPFIKLLD